MDIASRQPARLRGSATTLAGIFAGAAVAIANLRSKLDGKLESDAVASRDRQRAALDKALSRASGTWGGYQAAPPVDYRRPD